MNRFEFIPWDIYVFIWLITSIIKFILFLIPILLGIAIFTLLERKLMAAFQKRKGPNVTGIWGLLQPFADGLKLLLKEDFVPVNANKSIFRIAPIYTFALSVASWAVIPFSSNFNYSTPGVGLLYIFTLSSLSVYGIILSGWASNSKYAFLGSLRSAAQLISYEVSIGFILICVILLHGTLDLRKIVFDQIYIWNIVPLFFVFLLFFISIIAETNRAPFDLPEAEAELVSGYNVEYGGISFALFFLAEYNSIILMSTLTVLLFFGGWWSIFSFFPEIYNNFFINILDCIILSLKVQIILTLFVWIRVAFPRYRYDQLMHLCWKVFLPLSMSFVVIIAILLNWSDNYPSTDIYMLADGEYCIFNIEDTVVLEKEKKTVNVFTGENKDIFEFDSNMFYNPLYSKKNKFFSNYIFFFKENLFFFEIKKISPLKNSLIKLNINFK